MGFDTSESGVNDSADPSENRLLEMYRSLNAVGKKRALQDLEDLAQIERYIKISNRDSEAI